MPISLKAFLQISLVYGVTLLMIATNLPVLGKESSMGVDEIIQLDKDDVTGVQLSQPAETVETPLKANIIHGYDLSVEDSRNLTDLWKAVINRNPVIQYGLKQLATPPELRYAHSSIMARTLSGLLSGATLLPYMMGADQYTTGATSISTQLVDRAIQRSKRIDPLTLPSDTELVELSGIVQSLQKDLVESYFRYKNSLLMSVKLEQFMERIQERYDRSLKSSGEEGQLSLKALYNTTNHQKWLTRQEAKQHFLVLERLVGNDGMKRLRFDSYNSSSTDVPIEKSSALSNEANEK